MISSLSLLSMYISMYPSIHPSIYPCIHPSILPLPLLNSLIAYQLCNSLTFAFYFAAIPFIHVPWPWLICKLPWEECCFCFLCPLQCSAWCLASERYSKKHFLLGYLKEMIAVGSYSKWVFHACWASLQGCHTGGSNTKCPGCSCHCHHLFPVELYPLSLLPFGTK